MKFLILTIFFFILNGQTIFAQITDKERGIEFYNQKKYAEAVESFKKVIEKEGYSIASLFYLGSSYENLENNKEAIRCYLLAHRKGLVVVENAFNEAVIEKTQLDNKGFADYVYDKIGTEVDLSLKSAERLQQLNSAEHQNLTREILIYKYFLKTGDFSITSKFSKFIENKNANVTFSPPPIYTDESRKNKATGEIKLYVMFLANGEIGFIVPRNKLPDGLTESAVEAAKNLKFVPAINNGKPITQIKTVVYKFVY